MGGETIVAAVIGLVSGGGGVRLASRFSGPDRDGAIARYYQRVIKDLMEENEQLRGRVRHLEERLEQLRAELGDRIRDLELAQDDPPGHLG